MGKLSIQPEQVVMISAGAAGIDRAIAETFLAHDYHVHICPRCCFSTARTTTTVCIRTSLASMSSR